MNSKSSLRLLESSKLLGCIVAGIAAAAGSAQEPEHARFLAECQRSYDEALEDCPRSYLMSLVLINSLADEQTVQKSREHVTGYASLPSLLKGVGKPEVDEEWLRDYAQKYIRENVDSANWMSWGNLFVHDDGQRIREVYRYPQQGNSSSVCVEWSRGARAKAGYFENPERHVEVDSWNPEEEPRPDAWGRESPFIRHYLDFLRWALEHGAEHVWDEKASRLQLQWLIDPQRPETQPSIPIPAPTAVAGGRYEVFLQRSSLAGPPGRLAFDLIVRVRDAQDSVVLEHLYLGAGGQAYYLLYQYVSYYPGTGVPQDWSLSLFTPLPPEAAALLTTIPEFQGAPVRDRRIAGECFEYPYSGATPSVEELLEYRETQGTATKEEGP